MALRPWIGRAARFSYPVLESTPRDRIAVENKFRRMEDAPAHPYLTGERGLSPALLGAGRFMRRVKIDERRNAIFPHFDALGLCGYEIKNRGYTGFSAGGEKGLWFSRTERADVKLVVAESAIDALSYAALFPDPGARYASIGGQMNARQPITSARPSQRLEDLMRPSRLITGTPKYTAVAAMWVCQARGDDQAERRSGAATRRGNGQPGFYGAGKAR